MSETAPVFENLVRQWGTYLVAKLCFTSVEDRAVLEQKIAQHAADNPVFGAGFGLTSTTTLQQVSMLLRNLEIIISQFHSRYEFPMLFSSLISTMDAIFGSPISEIAKRSNERALHTEQITSVEKLSEMDKVCINVFDYLSSLLDSASKCPGVDLNQIQLETVVVVFNYVEHYLPNSVRKSAGKILASVSASPKHAEMICTMFWEKFGELKKEKDFRNFSTWIDGIMDVQLSLDTPELMRTSVAFLSAFVSRARKIERGVLRMKFLACMWTVIKKLCKCDQLMEYSQVVQKIDEIYQVVTKWCDRKKHLVFCMEFLGHLMVDSYPMFFLKHESHFFDFLYRNIKNEKGSVPLLNVVLNTFKSMPKEYYIDHFADFKKQLDSQLFPFLFKVGNRVRKPRFETYEQNEVVVQILFQIGLKQLPPIIALIKAILGESNEEESEKARMTCLGVLAELTRTIPEEVRQFNDELFPFLQPMLLRTTSNKNEIELAVFTFPVIHPHDETILAQITQILFDIAVAEDPKLGSSCFLAVTSFIEKLVTFKRNPLLPLNFLNSLLNLLPTLPKTVISTKLSYLFTVFNSLSIAIGRELDNLDELHNGVSALTPEDWQSFRSELDRVMLLLLFYPHKDISKVASEIEQLCLNPAIAAIDQSCQPDAITLAQAIDATGPNYIAAIQYLQEKNTSAVKLLFLGVLDMWLSNRGRFDDVYTGKILYLLGAMASPEYGVSVLLIELFKLLRKTADDPHALQCIQTMNPRLWMIVINELNSWITTVGLTFAAFWSQITSIYFLISRNPDFPHQLVEEPKLVESFERYIANFWKMPHEYGGKDGYATCERGLKTLTSYVRYAPDHFSRIVENPVNAFEKFVAAFQGMICYHESSLFTPTFIETCIECLTTIFEYAQIDEYALFSSFLKWLAEIDEFFVSKPNSRVLMVKMLTVLLSRNSSLLEFYLDCCFTTNLTFAAKILLAMANVYLEQEADVAGEVSLLVAAILHLNSAHVSVRQASHKLMCLLVTRGQIFNNQGGPDFVMSLTSYCAPGYVDQTEHFLEFVTSELKSEVALSLFETFAKKFAFLEIPQAPVLSTLERLLILIAQPVDRSAEILLFLSVQANVADVETAVALKGIWDHYLSMISESDVVTLLPFVMDFCIQHPSQKWTEKITAVDIFSVLFFKHPEATATQLIHILCSHESVLPKDVTEFAKYLDSADIDFAVTTKEVIAYNALSQILLLNEDQMLFERLFVPTLPQLTFYAMLMFDNDQFVLTPFRPLLDAILDSALLKFSKDSNAFAENLEALQSVNLLTIAASFKPEFSVNQDATRNILAYDNRVIATITKKMSEVVPAFGTKFLDILVSTAFNVKPCPKEVEPFLMLIALNDEITTTIMHQLLFFAVYAFTHDRQMLLDSLVAVVKQRLLSTTITDEEFDGEVVPAMILFLLYLYVDCRLSLSMQIVRVLGELCEKVCSSAHASEVSAEIMHFLEGYGGDAYVASLFLRFLSEAKSFGDPSVADTITALESFARMQASSGVLYNWCLLLALLGDGMRYFTGRYSTRSVDPSMKLDGLDWADVNSYVKFLVEHFGDAEQQKFILHFLGSVVKRFKSSDIGNDAAAMKILAAFLKQTKLEVKDDILTLALLLCLCDEQSCVSAAAEVAGDFILHRKSKLNQKELFIETLKPKFQEVTLRPIGQSRIVTETKVDPALLPDFNLFENINVSASTIVDALYSYLSCKLSTLVSE